MVEGRRSEVEGRSLEVDLVRLCIDPRAGFIYLCASLWTMWLQLAFQGYLYTPWRQI